MYMCNVQVIQALNSLVAEDKSNANAKEIVNLMYDTAMLTSGFDVESPKDYANKVYDMMGMALSGDSEVFLEHPQAIANGMVAVRQHAKAGELTVAWNYMQFSDTRTSRGRPTPLLGEHCREVLSELGYRESEIEQMFADSVVIEEVVAP